MNKREPVSVVTAGEAIHAALLVGPGEKIAGVRIPECPPKN
ncbi:hypothetical protein [Burkholderia cepacia]|nr:hypothetical protein [Burkholderia cepacia]